MQKIDATRVLDDANGMVTTWQLISGWRWAGDQWSNQDSENSGALGTVIISTRKHPVQPCRFQHGTSKFKSFRVAYSKHSTLRPFIDIYTDTYDVQSSIDSCLNDAKLYAVCSFHRRRGGISSLSTTVCIFPSQNLNTFIERIPACVSDIFCHTIQFENPPEKSFLSLCINLLCSKHTATICDLQKASRSFLLSLACQSITAVPTDNYVSFLLCRLTVRGLADLIIITRPVCAQYGKCPDTTLVSYSTELGAICGKIEQ